eukprot:9764409-Heterocapsa_arctica.AAC.1
MFVARFLPNGTAVRAPVKRLFKLHNGTAHVNPLGGTFLGGKTDPARGARQLGLNVYACSASAISIE